MLWKEDFDFKVLHFSKLHIHGVVRLQSESESWIHKHFLTGVNGNLELNYRKEVWKLIESIGRRMSSSWAVFGDFNEIFQQFKKSEGRDRSGK